MPRTRDILPGILAVRNPAIDQALSLALTRAEAGELGDLASAMLARGKANGVEALIAEFHRLPPDARQRLIDRADDFATSIRRAATRKDPEAAGNALAVIEQANATRLAYLAAALCRHPDPNVRERAGACLVTLAKRAVSSASAHEQPNMDAASTRYLIETVENAITRFSRDDRPDPLEAMLWLLPRPMPAARAALSKPEHPAVVPMVRLLNQPGSEATKRALVLLVGYAPLAQACRQALAQANATRQLAHPLAMGHLLALPDTRRGLRRADTLDALWPDAEQRQQMPPRARRWLPAYLKAMGHNTAEQAHKLAQLLSPIDNPADNPPDPATRLAVLRRLIDIARRPTPDAPPTPLGSAPATHPTTPHPATRAANDALAQLTRDPDPAIARTALWHLIHTDYDGLPRILADLIHSRHESIRRVATRRLAPLGFERFWQAWPRLSKERRLTAGRALIKIDDNLHRHLGARLASKDPATRLRALVIIATLNQGCFFEDALLELCNSDDKRIAASAVKALSGCTSDAAQQALALAIEHDDDRIRANAIEAMSQSQAAANLHTLLQLAEEDAQRPRANAIKALLELSVKDALPALTRMLDDTRSGHRISALWLIDEMGILPLARLVAEMSLTDRDEHVKSRAARVIGHLIDDLRRPDEDTPRQHTGPEPSTQTTGAA